jgi:hypothetical protein
VFADSHPYRAARLPEQATGIGVLPSFYAKKKLFGSP